MAWDSSKPGDTEKIRDLGTVIRPNWLSLEQGEDSNAMSNSNSGSYIQQYSLALIERNGRANNDAPTTESETLFHYCAQDANLVAEAYLKDPAGNAIQLTQSGSVGSIATTFRMESLNFGTQDAAAAEVTYDETMFPRAWGTFSTAGVLGSNKYITGVAKNSTGNYTVDITNLNFAAATDYVVFLTPGTLNVIANVSTKTATDFIVRTNDDNGDARNSIINVLIMMA